MSEKPDQHEPQRDAAENADQGGTATKARPQTRTQTRTQTRPAPPKLDRLPTYRVLLHNDDINEMLDVVGAILELTSLNRTKAFEAMMTAHQRGMCLLLLTHRERAELYEEQFRAKRLIVTIEPNV